jgi:hypothetical protein
MPLPRVDRACSQTYSGVCILTAMDLDAHPAYGEKTMKNTQPASSKLPGEIRDLLYRIEQSSPSRRIAEEPAIPEKTLRRWCGSDEEFTAARSLAGKLGIRLLD